LPTHQGFRGIPLLLQAEFRINIQSVNPKSRTFPWTIGIGLLLLLMCMGLALVYAALVQRRAQAARLPVFSVLSDFKLTNQNGATVTLATLKGHVWVADIIFTRCAGPCLTMSRQMQELQSALPASSPVRLVSLTTDPDFDTPPVLTRYAERFGADTNRWMFLTGTKPGLAALAQNGLKLSAVEKTSEERESPEDLFIHSTIFVTVDKQGRLRGVFQTEGPEVSWPVEKQKILSAVAQLNEEK
jgi:cytochrome oxidase Cu insertion factor (SCO1/SenC/PrrC family)